MREIDTDALLSVASLLGIGNPATVVEQVTFDDSNLQQVLGVYPLIAKASGFYREFEVALDPAMSSIERDATALGDALEAKPGGLPSILEDAEELLGVSNRFLLDVYLVRLYAMISQADAGNIAEVQMGVQSQWGTGTARSMPLFQGTSTFAIDPLRATGYEGVVSGGNRGHLQNYPVLPLQIANTGGGESFLLSMSSAGAGGSLDTIFRFGLWICRKNVPLTFAV